MTKRAKTANKPPVQASAKATQGKSGQATGVGGPTANLPPPVSAGLEAPRFTTLAPPVMGASSAGWHEHEPFLHCPKKYHLAITWGITKPLLTTPDPLGVGGLFHAGRAHWFHYGFQSNAPYWAACQEYMRDAALRYRLPVREDAIQRAISYVEQYIDYWVNRTRPTVIGVEYLLSAGIPGLVKERTARLDDVSIYPEANFSLAIGEVKTTSVSVKDAAQEYEMHGQVMKQDLLWRLSPEGAQKHGDIKFILLDVIVKGYGKEKCQFGRVPIRIYDFAREWYQRELARSIGVTMGLTKESIGVPRNITSCTRLIGRMRVDCPYKSLCRQGPAAAPAYVDSEGKSLVNYIRRDGPKPWD